MNHLKRKMYSMAIFIVLLLGLVPYVDSNENGFILKSTNELKAFGFEENGLYSLQTYDIPDIIEDENGCFADAETAIYTNSCIPFPSSCGNRTFIEGRTRRTSDWVCIDEVL